MGLDETLTRVHGVSHEHVEGAIGLCVLRPMLRVGGDIGRDALVFAPAADDVLVIILLPDIGEVQFPPGATGYGGLEGADDRREGTARGPGESFELCIGERDRWE